jgi:hypothetical protein
VVNTEPLNATPEAKTGAIHRLLEVSQAQKLEPQAVQVVVSGSNPRRARALLLQIAAQPNPQ